MLLALDYDGTYDADPQLWDDFIFNAVGRGHAVILATSRSTTDGLPKIPGIVEAIPCGATHKRAACKAIGYEPAIWIDDQPETVNGPGWLWLQRLKGFVKAALRRL